MHGQDKCGPYLLPLDPVSPPPDMAWMMGRHLMGKGRAPKFRTHGSRLASMSLGFLRREGIQ